MNSVYTFNLKDAQKKQEEQDANAEAKQLGAMVLAAIAGIMFAPFIVWGAWNLCIPALFGLPSIGYFQSLALYILIKILK